MQTGFAMLEAGIVSQKNVQNILLKVRAPLLFFLLSSLLVAWHFLSQKKNAEQTVSHVLKAK